MWDLFPVFALSSGPLDPLFRIQKQTAGVHNPSLSYQYNGHTKMDENKFLRDLKVPKSEILISWILMIFFIMKSLKVGDFRDEIKILIFYRWMRYRTFCCATACAVYASKLLPHAQFALANCYRMSVR
jgi:hypothetical protein